MGSDYLQFRAIIIDYDTGRRMRLKQAAAAVPQFNKVNQFPTPGDALNHLQGAERCDVVFLSYHFSRDEIETFIRQAKETKQGSDSAYVLVLKSKNQDHETVAGSVMLGVDGFLFEPYSVDCLVEITQLATKIRMEREMTRERVASTLLLTDIIHQLDLVASLKGYGYLTGTSSKKLEDLCDQLKVLTNSSGIQTEVLIKMFTEINTPRKMFRARQYGGVSERVRKRMEQKLMGDVSKLLEQSRAAK